MGPLDREPSSPAFVPDDEAGRQRDSEYPGLSIRHILVPLDGSDLAERVLPLVLAVTRAFSARITLLRVLETHPSAVGTEIDVVDWEMLRAGARSALDRIDAQLRARGLASGADLVEGRSAEQILSFARDHQVDLIVLSSHGEGGLSAWALSSTAQKVIGRTHTSILIVPAYAVQGESIGERRLQRILLPLDCSPRAECILPLAAELACAHGAELILAHVVPEPDLPRRMAPSRDDIALARQLTERNRLEAEHYLSQLQERLSAHGTRTRLCTTVSSRRARAILDLAEREDVDLVVMAAHGNTGDARQSYGEVATGLIQQSPRPVLVLQDLAGTVRETGPAAEAARSRPGH
jgi:nucleotide-binding universal stress UspA family protein